MRTLAIDYGKRRVGIALSDAGGTLATPIEVIHVETDAALIDSITRVIHEEGVQRVVVGLPLNMDGSIGPAANEVIAWAKRLPDMVIVDPPAPVWLIVNCAIGVG